MRRAPMDIRVQRQDNPNIPAPEPRLPAIPTYGLYGERAGELLADRLHCESIAARSRRYDWEIGPHRHGTFIQILYIRAGGGQATLDAQEIALVPPCAIVVPPGVPHAFRFERDTDGVVVTAIARHVEAQIAALGGLAAALSRPRVLACAGDPARAAELDRRFSALADEFSRQQPWRAPAIDLLLTLALVALGRSLAAPAGDAGGGERKLRHLRRYRELIDRHFREQRSIVWYADRVGITPTQLNRICREALDRTALQVLSDRVLLEATRDLVYTVLGVKEIAATLGFADPAYFSRFFARHTGKTPLAYRHAAHRELAARRVSSG